MPITFNPIQRKCCTSWPGDGQNSPTNFLLQGNDFSSWGFTRQKFVTAITLCIKAATWHVTPYSMQAFCAGPCLMLTVEMDMLFPSTSVISPSKRYESEKCPTKKLVFLLGTEILSRSTSLTASCRCYHMETSLTGGPAGCAMYLLATATCLSHRRYLDPGLCFRHGLPRPCVCDPTISIWRAPLTTWSPTDRCGPKMRSSDQLQTHLPQTRRDFSKINP